MVYLTWSSEECPLGVYKLSFSSKTPKRNTNSLWRPVCCPDSSKVPLIRRKTKEAQNPIFNSHKNERSYQHTTLTSLADEQSANEARVVVLHHVLVGDVGVGETVGIIGQRGNLWRHLPGVNMFTIGLHDVVLFFLL